MAIFEAIEQLKNPAYLRNERHGDYHKQQEIEDINRFKNQASSYTIYLYLDIQSQRCVPFNEERKAFCSGYILGGLIYDVWGTKYKAGLQHGSLEQLRSITDDILCHDGLYDAFEDDFEIETTTRDILDLIRNRYDRSRSPKSTTLFDMHKAFVIGYRVARTALKDRNGDYLHIGNTDIRKFADYTIGEQCEILRDTALEIQNLINRLATE